MSNNPDQIRNDIERTRGELEVDVDALAEKVRPSSIVHRQAEKARGAMTSVKERVMGTTHDAEGKMHETGERMHEGQQKAMQKIEGNPLAVGLMAFGAGLLIAALIPPSRKEHDLIESAKSRTEGMQHEFADAAKRVATEVKESSGRDIADTAAQAARDVADTAKDAARNVGAEGSAAASDIKDTAGEAARDVRDTARDA